MRMPNKHPAEAKLMTLPFALEIKPGSTIVSASLLSIVTASGVDANPSAVVSGALLVDNQGLAVYAMVQGGNDGCDYFGEVLVVDSDTQRHVRQFTLPVRSRIARD